MTTNSEQPLQESSADEQAFLFKEARQVVHNIDIISQLLPISNLEREAATGKQSS